MAEERKNQEAENIAPPAKVEATITPEQQEPSFEEKTLDKEKVFNEEILPNGRKTVSEDGSIMVRVGNFIVIKDTEKEHPYITVAPISRDWYVGYGPGSLVREYLETTLFADVPPTDTDIASCIMFFTGVMAGATILNAGFTDKVIKAVQEMVENQPLAEEPNEEE